MLLHGFMSCNAQWMLNRDALSRTHYLVMVELWGHGRSPASQRREDHSVSAYIQQFEQIRDRLGIASWDLIGQSYGAGLVLRYADAHPDTCRRLVVTNSRSAFGPRERRSKLAQRGRSAIQNDSEFHPRQLPFHPIHAQRLPANVLQAMIPSADAMSLETVQLSGTFVAQLNANDLLERLKSRLLIVNGKYEKSFQADVERLLASHPDLRVAHLDGGHSVNIDAAEDFNREVLGFLSG